jgi:UDP-glucose 4-epimerase
MKKIVILGATGNAGSYLTTYAKEFFDSKEYEVIASGRRKTDYFERLEIQYYSVDIGKKEELDTLPTENVYAVILLAATIPAYMDGYHPRDYIDSIINGTYNVLEYCKKVNSDRIIYTTTCYDVWEYPTGTVIKPNMKLNFKYTGDHAVYVIAKNAAIELIEHYLQEYGLKRFIFRLPSIYSYSPNHYIYPNGVKTLRPLYKLINNAINSYPLEIWGDPGYSKDMLHVFDFCQMLCKTVQVDLEGGFYNCGTGIPISLQEEIETIIRVFSPKDNPSTIKYRSDKIAGGGILMDVENAKKELGYQPIYDCEKLFLDFKDEMKINRFIELRGV